MVGRVPRRGKELQGQVAAVDGQLLVEEQRGRHEAHVAKDRRLGGLHAVQRLRRFALSKGGGAAQAGDDRRRVRCVRPDEELVAPGVVVVGVRVDDEQRAPGQVRLGERNHLPRGRRVDERVDKHDVARRDDDEGLHQPAIAADEDAFVPALVGQQVDLVAMRHNSDFPYLLPPSAARLARWMPLVVHDCAQIPVNWFLGSLTG